MNFNDLPTSISDFEEYIKQLAKKHKNKFDTDIVEIKLYYAFHCKSLDIIMSALDPIHFCCNETTPDVSYFYKFETDEFLFPDYIGDVKDYSFYRQQLYHFVLMLQDKNMPFAILERLSEMFFNQHCNLNSYSEKSKRHLSFLTNLLNNQYLNNLIEELEQLKHMKDDKMSYRRSIHSFYLKFKDLPNTYEDFVKMIVDKILQAMSDNKIPTKPLLVRFDFYFTSPIVCVELYPITMDDLLNRYFRLPTYILDPNKTPVKLEIPPNVTNPEYQYILKLLYNLSILMNRLNQMGASSDIIRKLCKMYIYIDFFNAFVNCRSDIDIKYTLRRIKLVETFLKEIISSGLNIGDFEEMLEHAAETARESVDTNIDTQ